jgi:hypothetical protein
MVSSSIPPLIGLFYLVIAPVFTVLFVYAAYRALVIRRVIAVRLYRRQSLWVGISGFYWAFFTLGLGLAAALYSQNPAFVSSHSIIAYSVFVALYGALIVSFLWIDSTIRVARRSDPLLRDALLWSKLRVFLWAVIFAGMALGLIFAPPSIVSSSGGNPVTEIISFYNANVIAFWIVGFASLAALIVSGLRSKDVSLRRQILALGVYVIALIFQGVPSVIVGDLHLGESGALVAILAVVAYLINSLALVRTARSLAPLNKLSLDNAN